MLSSAPWSADSMRSMEVSKCSVCQGRLHGEVDGRHRDLVVIAHGCVGFVQQGRKIGEATLPGQFQRCAGSIIFTDHMPDPPAHQFVGKSCQRRVQVRDITQSPDPQDRSSPLACGAALPVLPFDMAVRGAGVEDQDFEPLPTQRQRYISGLKSATVEEESVARVTEDAGCLVQDAGGSAHVDVFSPLRQPCALHGGDVQAEEVAGRSYHRALDCRGARQSCAERLVIIYVRFSVTL